MSQRKRAAKSSERSRSSAPALKAVKEMSVAEMKAELKRYGVQPETLKRELVPQLESERAEHLARLKYREKHPSKKKKSLAACSACNNTRTWNDDLQCSDCHQCDACSYVRECTKCASMICFRCDTERAARTCECCRNVLCKPCGGVFASCAKCTRDYCRACALPDDQQCNVCNDGFCRHCGCYCSADD